jgi:hypothetical protein
MGAAVGAVGAVKVKAKAELARRDVTGQARQPGQQGGQRLIV